MREMLRTMFSAFTSLFRALDLGARTLENCALWAEGESSSLETEARVEREARLRALYQELGLEHIQREPPTKAPYIEAA